MEKETQKRQRGSFTVKQAFGIILFVVSFVVMLCLISAGKLFGMLGVNIFCFVLGTFGYSAYAVFLFLIYLGLSIFADLKLKIRKRTLAFLFLCLLFLIFIVHNATSAQFYPLTFAEYETKCFEAGMNGLSTATFGGVVFGLPCYFFSKILTVAGSYVVYSILLLGTLALLFDVKRLLAERKRVGFRGEKKKKIKTNGVKEYDVSGVVADENFDVERVDQKLFIADIDDYLPKRTRKKSEALDILLSNQTPNADEKITYMDGKMYTAKQDIADKLGKDIFNTETAYTDSYSKKPEKKAEKTDKRDRKSIILTPPDNMDDYFQSILPEKKKETKFPESGTGRSIGDYKNALGIGNGSSSDSDKIRARDFRGEFKPEPPKDEDEEDSRVNRYEGYANGLGLFIDNTAKGKKKEPREIGPETEPRNIVNPPAQKPEPQSGAGFNTSVSGGAAQSNFEQKPILSESTRRQEPPKYEPPAKREEAEDSRPPIISDSTSRRPEPVRDPLPEPKREDRYGSGNTFGFDFPVSSNGDTGEVSYHELKGDVLPSEPARETFKEPAFKQREKREIAEPVRRAEIERFESPSEPEPKVSEPVYEDSTIVTLPKKPRKYIYQTPPVELLNDFSFNPNNVDENFEERRTIIEQTLSDFKIDAKVVNIVAGPSVTRYELQMPPGIPVNRVIQRSDDIAMAVASSSGVRIEAPIPGKSLVGIEVPNKKKQMVVLRDVLDNPTFFSHQSPIVFALGKEIDGKNMLCDIAKMPHLLVAGSTGSGKSVCLNALIISILYKASPEDVRIILIDPKRVEFAVYTGLPHLLLKDIITDVDKAISALNWTVGEMTRRFDLFKQIGAKDLASYNAKIDRETTEKLPRIVLIVDELAELMATKAKADVELKIQRITQLSRAAGIHLVLATQRPSVDVITGVIKANLPSRIAFRVSSQVDSRTILDAGGGEKLLGNGDMIYTTPSVQTQMRLQGPFVSMEEVEGVVEFIKTNNEAYFDDLIEKSISNVKPAAPEGEDKEDGSDEDGDECGADKIFVDALRLAVDSGQISISMVQRRFSVGYARAGKLIDEMEKMGYVSPFEGSKPRKVLISAEEFNQKFGES